VPYICYGIVWGGYSVSLLELWDCGVQGNAIAQAVSYQFLVTEVKVQSQGILVDRETMGQVCAQVLWFSPLHIISPLLYVHTHLSAIDSI
jgi:hypothetical protein